MELSHEGKRPCPSVRRLADSKLADLDRKLVEPLAYRRELAARTSQGEELPDGAHDAAVCQFIELSTNEKNPLTLYLDGGFRLDDVSEKVRRNIFQRG